MRIAILLLPETRVAPEFTSVITQLGIEFSEFLLTESTEKWSTFDGYILLGSMDYKESALFNSAMSAIQQQSDQSKPIIGIGSGAKLLVEAGCVPGIENNKVGLAFKQLSSAETETKIHLSSRYQYNAFTRCLKAATVFHFPEEPAIGEWAIPPALLLEMQENGLDVFHYHDMQGVAAVSNKMGNVLAMLPNLIKCLPLAKAILQSMCEYFNEGYKQKVAPLYYHPR